MRQYWLAVLLLFATLSSNPLGSVQQGTFDQILQPAPPAALPFARPSGNAAVAELLRTLRISDPEPVPFSLLDIEASGFAVPPTRIHLPANLPSEPGSASFILERLPYHATAPPFLR